MTQIKRVAAAIAALAAISFSFAAIATGVGIVGVTVNDEVRLPLWANGTFSYDGTSLALQADGFLLCGNAGNTQVPDRWVLPRFEDSNWQLPAAFDLRNLVYGDGGPQLSINRGVVDSSLVCHSLDSAGHVRSPAFADSVFYQGFDDGAFNQTLPPTKPTEAVDVYAAGTVSCGTAAPSATCMNTLAYSQSAQAMFAYTFKVFGGMSSAFVDQGAQVGMDVGDAYDADFLGANPADPTDFGDYCVSITPFADLEGACPDHASGNVTITGRLSADASFVRVPFTLPANPNPMVRYVLVHRYVTAAGGLPANHPKPFVAASAFAGPLSAQFRSDIYVDDDTLFGCYPTGICGRRSVAN
jgi:hypothetical protein